MPHPYALSLGANGEAYGTLSCPFNDMSCQAVNDISYMNSHFRQRPNRQ